MKSFLGPTFIAGKCFLSAFGVFTLSIITSKVNAQNAEADTITGKVHQIPDVTISVRKTPPAVIATSPFQMLKKTDLERLGAYDVADAVRHFSGVSVKDYGGIGGLKTISVRSMGAQHTGVIYDGVSVSDCQSGQVDISRYSLYNVSELSMTIGQTDNIYQTAKAFASAGVLNIKTITPEMEKGKYNLNANFKTGSYGLINPSLMYNHQITNKTAISFYGDYLQADGNYRFKMMNGNQLIDAKRNNSDIRSYRAEANLFTKITDKQDLQLKAYLFDSERGLPGSVVYDNPYSVERLYDKNYFGQLKYENRWNKRFKMQVLGKFNYSWNRDYDHEASGETDDRYRQTETYLSAVFWSMPVDRLSISFAQDFAYNYLHTNLRDCQFPERFTLLSVLAARYELSNFSASASLLNTYITENVKIGKPADDRKRLSPAFSLSWKPFQEHGFRIRASYKDIFRTPTFNDLYYLLVGNTRLKPETTRQGNLGLTWSLSNATDNLKYISLSADAYYNKVKDKIVAVPTMFVWKMSNVGDVETIGTDVNLSAEYRLHDKINCFITANYNFIQAEDVTDPSSKTWRNQIIYTPKHSGSMSFTVENPWVNLTYNVSFASERYTLAQNTPKYRIEPYTDHSITAYRNFSWNKHKFKLQLDALNLGGKNYEVIRFYPMPGRNFKISLSYFLK